MPVVECLKFKGSPQRTDAALRCQRRDQRRKDRDHDVEDPLPCSFRTFLHLILLF